MSIYSSLPDLTKFVNTNTDNNVVEDEEGEEQLGSGHKFRQFLSTFELNGRASQDHQDLARNISSTIFSHTIHKQPILSHQKHSSISNSDDTLLDESVQSSVTMLEKPKLHHSQPEQQISKKNLLKTSKSGDLSELLSKTSIPTPSIYEPELLAPEPRPLQPKNKPSYATQLSTSLDQLNGIKSKLLSTLNSSRDVTVVASSSSRNGSFTDLRTSSSPHGLASQLPPAPPGLLRGSVSSLQLRDQDYDRVIEENEHLRNRSEKLGDLESKFSELMDNLSRSSKMVEEKSRIISQLRREHEMDSNTIADLTKQNARLNKNNQDLSEKYAALKQRNEAAEKELRLKEREVSAYNDDLFNAIQTIKMLETRLGQLAQDNRDLEAENKELKDLTEILMPTSPLIGRSSSYWHPLRP